MSSTGLSVRSLFGAERIDLTGDAVDRLTSRETYGRLDEQLRERAGPTWAAIRHAVPGQLDRLLDIDVVQILVEGWNKARELRKYRDEAKYPPENVNLVSLTRHKLTSTHTPALEIVVEGRPIGRLNFEIELGFAFDGAELTIQGGRIRKIRTGRSLGVGTIKCEGAILGQAEKKLLPLPGVIDLGEGVLIPAERTAARGS